MGKTLITYFSRAGENYYAGEIKNVEQGNNEKIVAFLTERLDADVFRIEMQIPYSEDYIKCTEEAKADLAKGNYPKLKAYMDNLEGYDKVIIVYPNYWGNVPMAIISYCKPLVWNGVTVYPICSNEGSGFGNSISTLRKICRGANFETGLSIVGNQIDNAGEDIEDWLRDKDLI